MDNTEKKMTVEELYNRLGADYRDAVSRMLKDERIEKYLRKFLHDPSMSEFDRAMEDYSHESIPISNRREAVFCAAHTLKGVAANLALTPLHAAASAVVEQMRDRGSDPSDNLVSDLRAAYSAVVGVLRKELS